MKNKLKIALSSIATSLLLIVIPITISNSNNTSLSYKMLSSNKSKGFIYNNEFFPDIESVGVRYLDEHPETINNSFYIGNLSRAILDPSTGLVNINELRPYDSSRISPAYIDALGNYTSDYEKAKKSYVNPGLIRYQYYDFNNNLFSSYEEAKESIINSKHPIGVQYYDGNLFDDINVDKFNPLSKNDLQEFKRRAFNEIQS